MRESNVVRKPIDDYTETSDPKDAEQSREVPCIYECEMEFSRDGDLRAEVLKVTLEYEQTTLESEYERAMDYYQEKFSKRAGRLIKRSEIEISPAVGERGKVSTCIIWDGESCYSIMNTGLLQEMHTRAPYVLPRLREDLKNEKKKWKKRSHESNLIHNAINSVNYVIDPSQVCSATN